MIVKHEDIMRSLVCIIYTHIIYVKLESTGILIENKHIDPMFSFKFHRYV